MAVSRTRVNPEIPSTSGTTGRRYAGVDPEERQRQRKARLVEAALAVFGEKGFHPATVRDVCKEAKLTSRYFYESFDSMEALFRSVYGSISRELMQVTIVALAQCPPDPEKLSEAAIRAFLEFIQEDPRRARVGLIDALNVGEGMNSLANKASQDYAQLVGAFVSQFFPNLAELGLNPTIIADGLVGSSNRIATQWVAEKCKTPLDEVLHNCVSIFRACIEMAQRGSTPPP
ncbi:TetR/AcrR family transcriptional regulator [Aquabacterium sp.]|uniref:TetR/AcrR family transcriptional regulator n=1 Tax=Aquabacterium sp. TaxID=1872578 RepID=UPI002486E09D|nr:TetR/AcrR family transcriptional regulator [Aquabacterium sp.]MDI1260018.1 TetR/AcrR family transcriptional regulator [Aquabacterium sp.]